MQALALLLIILALALAFWVAFEVLEGGWE